MIPIDAKNTILIGVVNMIPNVVPSLVSIVVVNSVLKSVV